MLIIKECYPLFSRALSCFGVLLRPVPSGPSVAAKISYPPPASQYVGNDRCRSCHRPEFLEFGQTSHAEIRVKGVAMTCDTCHGPGKAHSDAEEAAHGDDAKTAAANKLIFAFHGNAKENAGTHARGGELVP